MPQPNKTPQRATDAPTDVKVRAKMDPVAKLLGTSRTVAYRPEFAHITGMVTAGLLLSQFWYWSECPTTEKRDGWFYMTMDQISEQTGMIREEQETARKRLKAIGVLQEERRGNPGKMWFRVDEDRLYELLRGYAEIVKAGIPQCDNPAIKNAGIPQSKVRELRNVARGNVTINNAGIPHCILLESSSGESLDSSLETREDPPINPPEGEDADAESISGPKGTCTDATANHAEVVWSSVKTRLAKPIRLPLKLIDLTETTATLETNDSWARNWLEDHKGAVLQEAFLQATGRAITLQFTVGG